VGANEASVQITEGTTENDQAEAAALQAAATISPDQAKQAALAAVPGTAGKVELESENGNVVYGVEVTANGTTTDVKVDAGNGSVLAKDADQNEGDQRRRIRWRGPRFRPGAARRPRELTWQPLSTTSDRSAFPASCNVASRTCGHTQIDGCARTDR
jgi:hypothetical protein